jgi:hypothetical protein
MFKSGIPHCVFQLYIDVAGVHTGAQYSAVEYTSANEAVRSRALAPQFVPVSFRTNLTRAATIFVVLVLFSV